MIQRAVRTLTVLALAALLAACANGYERYYKPADVPYTGGFESFTGEPRIQASSGDARRDLYNMFEDGYGYIGQSSFVGPAARDSGAIAQAKKVGAAVVVVTGNIKARPAERYRSRRLPCRRPPPPAQSTHMAAADTRQAPTTGPQPPTEQKRLTSHIRSIGTTNWPYILLRSRARALAFLQRR